MKKLKKRFIIPAVVFILGMCALIGAIYVVGKSQEQQNRTNAKLNAMTYTERIYGELMEGIGVTDSLKQVVISGDGNINRFYDIAANMMDDSIQSIQIAPNGVVTEIYPEERNESSKIDLINDSDRGEISRYARDNDTVIMQGPFELKQGGYGIAVRNPGYLEDENGKKSQREREVKAAERLFGMLPKDQAVKFRNLWEEFEAQETKEAKFARTMDNIQPVVLNDASDGKSWVEHGVHLSQILNRNKNTAKGSEVIWNYAKENFIDENVRKGNIIND